MSHVTNVTNHVTHTQQRTKVTGDPNKVDTYFSQIDAGYKTLVELSDRWDEYMAAGDGDVYIHPPFHPTPIHPPPHTPTPPLPSASPALFLSHTYTHTHIHTLTSLWPLAMATNIYPPPALYTHISPPLLPFALPPHMHTHTPTHTNTRIHTH